MEITVTSLLTSLWLLSSIYFYRQQQSPRLPLPQQGTGNCLIVYASQTGQARQLAEELSEQLACQVKQGNDAGGDRRFNIQDIQLASMAQITPAVLHRYQQVLFIVSTAGHGEPPDAARAFSNMLRRIQHGRFQSANTGFAVLALGDSHYEHFCAYGRWLEAELLRCGLSPLWPRVDVDRCAPSDLQSWQHQLNQYFAISLSAHQAQTSHCYRLTARTALNPGSPNAALFWLSLKPSEQAQDIQAQAGDIVDIHLPNQQIRSYSLANAPVASHGQAGPIELIVRQHTRADGTPGLGSFYLTERVDGASEVHLSIRRGTQWQYPEHNVPWILIAAGSGLAGIRSALDWRAQQPEQQATWVIFGERDPDYDRPGFQEFSDQLEQGTISDLSYVWSQHPKHRAYVQDVLVQQQERLRQYLLMGGLIYVCGSANGMGESVDSTLHALLGESAMQVLTKQSRYIRDIY